MWFVAFTAVLITLLVIPKTRTAIFDGIDRLMTPLPDDFWNMDEYRGEHIEKDEHKDD